MKFSELEYFFPTILDRLTRLKPAYIRYSKVFSEIIQKTNSTHTNQDIEKINLIKEIFSETPIPNPQINKKFNTLTKTLENKYFIKNPQSDIYLDYEFNISYLLDKIDINHCPKNVQWLYRVLKSEGDLKILRQKESLLYPLERVIIVEGETERILLSTLMKLFDLDFEKAGFLIISAGGKNQAVRKYYELIEYLKLPITILLDNDAQASYEMIEQKLRSDDKIYILRSGEFEDLIPKDILLNTINHFHKNELLAKKEDFNDKNKMVENLENIYRIYGFGEFKKAKFAQNLNEYIQCRAKKEDFENSEIKDIAEFLKESL